MARITPRSINIREMERAKTAIESLQNHCLSLLTSYANGIEDYQNLHMDAPEIYYIHGAKLTAIMEALETISRLVDEILKEL